MGDPQNVPVAQLSVPGCVSTPLRKGNGPAAAKAGSAACLETTRTSKAAYHPTMRTPLTRLGWERAGLHGIDVVVSHNGTVYTVDPGAWWCDAPIFRSTYITVYRESDVNGNVRWVGRKYKPLPTDSAAMRGMDLAELLRVPYIEFPDSHLADSADPRLPPLGLGWVWSEHNPLSRPPGEETYATFHMDPNFALALARQTLWDIKMHCHFSHEAREWVINIIQCGAMLRTVSPEANKKRLPPLPFEIWLSILQLVRQGDMLTRASQEGRGITEELDRRFPSESLVLDRKSWAAHRAADARIHGGLDFAMHNMVRLRRAEALRNLGSTRPTSRERRRQTAREEKAAAVAAAKARVAEHAALVASADERSHRTRKYVRNDECRYRTDDVDGADGGECDVPFHPDFGKDPVGDYPKLLRRKQETLRSQFSRFFTSADMPFDTFPSKPLHWRLRCRLSLRRDVEGRIIGWGSGPGRDILSTLPIASLRINELMRSLLGELQCRPSFGTATLTQVHFLTTLGTQDACVTMVYAREPPPLKQWSVDAASIHKALGVSIIGQGRGFRANEGSDFVEERLKVEGMDHTLSYRQAAGSFSNPNGDINEKCLAWLRECCQEIAGDKHHDSLLLELFCGCGNHTCAIAPLFSNVVAVELDPRLVELARFNLSRNGVTNATVLRCPSEDFALKVLDDGATILPSGESARFDVVLLDPPRAGMDDRTVELASQFDHILIISCNQSQLERVLDVLAKTHRVRRFAFFDHFPFTAHTETGVWLSRQSLGSSDTPP